MNRTIRIGTRDSKLALWQAEYVAELIRRSNYRTEIIPIQTKGDKILDVSISKIGSKGVFTEELEAQLLEGTIDVAVHSAKDLASDMHDELELLAFTEREQPNDVVISNKKNINLSTNSIRVGTSSTRRVAFVKHFFPHAETVSIRGNLQTRINKMEEGACDALLLAYAGVHRLGFDHLITEHLETSYFVPPVGQGSVAVQCHRKLSFDKKDVVQRWVNHDETEDCIRTERSFLKTLQGGCSVPAFGFAFFEGNYITLKGGIISLDGQRIVKVKRSASVAEGKELGKKVALEVLTDGGQEILDEINKQNLNIA